MAYFFIVVSATIALVSHVIHRPIEIPEVAGPYVSVPAPPRPTAVIPQTAWPCVRQRTTIEPLDILAIVVGGEPGLTRSYTVGDAGDVSLPMLGAIPAVGLTPGALREQLQNLLADGYMNDPIVQVFIATDTCLEREGLARPVP